MSQSKNVCSHGHCHYLHQIKIFEIFTSPTLLLKIFSTSNLAPLFITFTESPVKWNWNLTEIRHS